jgi:hypothetical protein
VATSHFSRHLLQRSRRSTRSAASAAPGASGGGASRRGQRAWQQKAHCPFQLPAPTVKSDHLAPAQEITRSLFSPAQQHPVKNLQPPQPPIRPPARARPPARPPRPRPPPPHTHTHTPPVASISSPMADLTSECSMTSLRGSTPSGLSASRDVSCSSAARLVATCGRQGAKAWRGVCMVTSVVVVMLVRVGGGGASQGP